MLDNQHDPANQPPSISSYRIYSLPVAVRRLLWPCGDILKDFCKPVIANFTQDGPPPAGYEEVVGRPSVPDAPASPRSSSLPLIDAFAQGTGGCEAQVPGAAFRR